MLDDDAVLALADEVTYHALGPGEETVILCLKSGYLYTCNETTARPLMALDGRRTLVQVAELLEQEYYVPPATLRRDLAHLAEQMLKENLIVERPTPC